MERNPPIALKYWKLIPTCVQAALLGLLGKLFEQIGNLRDEVKRLRKELARLKERAGRNSTNSSFPPSSDKPDVKRPPPKKGSRRKKGAQKGHRKHERKLAPPEDVTKTIACKPAACGQCGEKLDGQDADPRRHQVWEIPPIKPVITEYQIHSLECPHCHTSTKGQLPAGVGRGHFGPRLTSLIAMLTGVYRLSKRNIQKLCADVLGLAISTGQVCRLQASTAAVLGPCVQEAREYVATQPANIDETGWKEGLRKCWLWVAPCAGWDFVAVDVSQVRAFSPPGFLRRTGVGNRMRLREDGCNLSGIARSRGGIVDVRLHRRHRTDQQLGRTRGSSPGDSAEDQLWH